MDFGDAIKAMKAGKRVARAGWNGKGMWVALEQRRVASHRDFSSEHNAAYAAQQQGGNVATLPFITMKTADGPVLIGWLASQSDILGEDWEAAE